MDIPDPFDVRELCRRLGDARGRAILFAELSDVSDDGYADLTTVTTTGELQVYGNGILLPPGQDYFKYATWTYPGWQGVHHVA